MEGPGWEIWRAYVANVHRKWTAEERLGNLFDAIENDILTMSDEALYEEIRDGGEDPDEVAERTRALMMKTLGDWKAKQARAVDGGKVE